MAIPFSKKVEKNFSVAYQALGAITLSGTAHYYPRYVGDSKFDYDLAVLYIGENSALDILNQMGVDIKKLPAVHGPILSFIEHNIFQNEIDKQHQTDTDNRENYELQKALPDGVGI